MFRVTSGDLSRPDRGPAKRLRPNWPVNNDSPDTISGNSKSPSFPALFPEMWAVVLDFLPYDSVLRCAAVSRSMLRDAMPRVTALHLHRPAQLHAALAPRYRDVRDIYVYSLIRFASGGGGPAPAPAPHEDETDCALDADTAARAVPFLCHFPRLERAFLGGQRPGGGKVEGFIPTRHDADEDRERMTTLIDAFSGAFRAGALARNLWVMGLRCPRSHRHTNAFGESSCLVCRNACQSFPLALVAEFECEGSSQKYLDRSLKSRVDFDSEQIYNLDVCLSKDTIEAILKRRPGGRALLSSEARLLDLLGTGTRYVIVPDDGNVCYVVKYDTQELGDIRHFIGNAGREFVKTLASEAVTNSIKRSFAEDERDLLPPSDQCYLAQNSFYALKEMGLPLDEFDFLNADEWDGNMCNRAVLPVNLYSYNWRFH